MVGENLRKRKRESKNSDVGIHAPASEDAVAEAVSCFTNAAFSSTPKRLVAARRLKLQTTNKYSRVGNFIDNACLEVKSIADLAKLDRAPASPNINQHVNPYEVVRKPPKKKKREADMEEACFENPALNLDLPEKQFNPFEVQRSAPLVAASQTNGFVNPALNLRGEDVPATRNPFEIYRSKLANASVGVENLALKAAPVASDLKIGLPFTPTVRCRIDFNNISLSELTPTKLLAEKLVFSPVPVPKRSLGAISEESSMDIGKELDQYQLELENSINEAKLRKKAALPSELQRQELMQTVTMEQKMTFKPKLNEITEKEDEDQTDVKEDVVSPEPQIEKGRDDFASLKEEIISGFENATEEDIAYFSDEDDANIGFKSPAPFIRTYRRDVCPRLALSKESLASAKSSKSADASDEHGKSTNVKNLIRSSIRKLMKPLHAGHDKDYKKQEAYDKDLNENIEPKACDKHSNFMANIRQSLRRKNKNQDQLVEGQKTEHEISIIDAKERTLKLKVNSMENSGLGGNQLGNEQKTSLRSSIRRSTRDMRQHIMKSVFHKKQEAYDFCK